MNEARDLSASVHLPEDVIGGFEVVLETSFVWFSACELGEAHVDQPEEGWETDFPDGSSIRCTCRFSSCLEEGTECGRTRRRRAGQAGPSARCSAREPCARGRPVLSLITMLPLALGVLQCPSVLDPAVEPRLACFIDKTPPCPADRRHCVGLHLHLAEGAGQTPVWMAAELEHAFQLFAPAELGFQVVAIDGLGPEDAIISTRAQRDDLGRPRFTRGLVHVFLVARLDDVDLPGEQIRGVHWRQRSNTDKRWLILSQIGSKVVLAHELGHFFGLPHSRYRDSVMNKRPREQPPWDERVFVAEELEIVLRERDAMLREGMLEALEPRAFAEP